MVHSRCRCRCILTRCRVWYGLWYSHITTRLFKFFYPCMPWEYFNGKSRRGETSWKLAWHLTRVCYRIVKYGFIQNRSLRPSYYFAFFLLIGSTNFYRSDWCKHKITFFVCNLSQIYANNIRLHENETSVQMCEMREAVCKYALWTRVCSHDKIVPIIIIRFYYYDYYDSISVWWDDYSALLDN